MGFIGGAKHGFIPFFFASMHIYVCSMTIVRSIFVALRFLGLRWLVFATIVSRRRTLPNAHNRFKPNVIAKTTS